MRKHITNHIIILFVAMAFLTPRIANLHILSHFSEDDNPISCEVCDIITNAQDFDLSYANGDPFSDYLNNVPTKVVVISFFNIPLETIVTPTTIHNKPPPLS